MKKKYKSFIFLSLAPPKFGKDFHDQQVELGEQFKIKIPFSGTGPFEVKVRKNGREVVENGRIKIMPFDDYVSLTINGKCCVTSAMLSCVFTHTLSCFINIHINKMTFSDTLECC